MAQPTLRDKSSKHTVALAMLRMLNVLQLGIGDVESLKVTSDSNS